LNLPKNYGSPDQNGLRLSPNCPHTCAGVASVVCPIAVNVPGCLRRRAE
jgi:hypothetical protein